ncbi:MAG: hypothetical protein GY866_15045 [Proteobacteria bacterium]|nr:hypothetical protein [Pseudomonadota bacterium]
MKTKQSRTKTLMRLLKIALVGTTSLAVLGCAELVEDTTDSQSGQSIVTEESLDASQTASDDDYAVDRILSSTGDDLNAADSDDDGVVSAEEFLSAHLEKHTELDTDGDGAVSKAEVLAQEKAKFEEEFAALDANGDGELSSDELPQSGRGPGGRPGIGDGRRPGGGHGPGGGREPGGRGEGRGPGGDVLASLDADEDGRISLEEWTTNGKSEEKFNELDGDGDGYLSQAELEAGRPAHGPADLDADGDGVVSQDEFVNRETRAEEHFEELDTNDDGLIDTDEITVAINDKFDRLDTNDDGELTQEDIPAGRPARGETS